VIGVSIAQEDAAGTYRLADGVTIADERELRQLVRAEEWCGHESMSNGVLRLVKMGITDHLRLAALPMDRLAIACSQLSPPEVPPPPPSLPPSHSLKCMGRWWLSILIDLAF
jgi:hypothetical protein